MAIRQDNRQPALWVRLLLAAAGHVVFTAGIYVTLRSNIGISPWDVLSMGISKQTRLSFGEAALIVSSVILVLDLLAGARIGPGTILDVVITGKGIDLFLAWDPLPLQTTIVTGILCMLAGLFLMALGQRIYMQQALGCGPRDLLLIALGKRIRRVPIGLVQTVILGTVIASGWMLGGDVGIGTLVSFFGMGSIMQVVFFASGRFDPRAVVHDSFRTLYAGGGV